MQGAIECHTVNLTVECPHCGEPETYVAPAKEHFYQCAECDKEIYVYVHVALSARAIKNQG